MAKKTPTKRRGDEGNKLAKRRSRLKYAYPIERDPDDTLGMYLKEVGSLPLLKAEQEVTLAKRIERGIKAREELASGRSGSKQVADLKVLIEDGWAAREHLLTANSRLVISVAKKYRSRGVPFADLIQEGNIGLIRATKKFEYRRGLKFSTYATWWIRQAVTRALSNFGRTVRIPVYVTDNITRYKKTAEALYIKSGKKPDIDEMAEAMGIKVKEAEKLRTFVDDVSPLENLDSTDNDNGRGIPERYQPARVDHAIVQFELDQQMEELMKELTEREAGIIRYRYGLTDGKAHTLEETGRAFSLTRERIRQIEKNVLKRLSEYARENAADFRP